MTYARIQNDQIIEYPIYEGDIRLRFPHVSFTLPFEPPEGYVRVIDIVQPTINYTKNITEGLPLKQDDNSWIRNWIVTSASQEEMEARIANQWDFVRTQRNEKLSKSDWTQLNDVTLTSEQQALWLNYRQDLRDITTQSDPFNILWPTI